MARLCCPPIAALLPTFWPVAPQRWRAPRWKEPTRVPVGHRYRTGIPWHDLPERYGHLEGRSQTVPAMVRQWRFHAGFRDYVRRCRQRVPDASTQRSCAHISIVPVPKKRWRGSSDRPLAWRTDDENPRGRRCARQSSRALAHGGAGSRCDAGRAVARRPRARRRDC